MAYRGKTTRRMPPKTRKLAKLINDLASVERRLKNLLPDIQTAEMYEIGERRRQEHSHPIEVKEGSKAKGIKVLFE